MNRVIMTTMFSIFIIATSVLQGTRVQASHSYTLSVVFESIDDMIDQSEVIATTLVTNDSEVIYKKIGSNTFRGIKQTVIIHEVLNNRLNSDFIKGDKIDVYSLSDVQTSNGWSKVFESNEMKAGKYLLFLNSIKEDEELLFVNNSPNHLYRLYNEDYDERKANNAFINMNGRTLIIINETELQAWINFKIILI